MSTATGVAQAAADCCAYLPILCVFFRNRGPCKRYVLALTRMLGHKLPPGTACIRVRDVHEGMFVFETCMFLER